MFITKSTLKIFIILVLVPYPQAHSKIQNRFELRGAAFFPSSCTFKNIYGHNIGDFQVEYAFAPVDFCLGGWANLDIFSKHGSSIGLCMPTKISIYNVSFGARFMHELPGCLIGYLGMGPSIGHLKLRNCISVCSGTEYLSKTVVGATFKAGIYYDVSRHCFLDLFVDYCYENAKFSDRIQVGGVKVGLGIGIR